MRLRNSLPMLVLTFLLYGGLNHITFLRRLRCYVGGPCGGGLNSSLYVYPLFLSASWYGGAASLKTHWTFRRGTPSPVPELSFLPAPYRGWTRAGERRVQDNLHAHTQNEPIKNCQVPTTLLASMYRAMPFSARALKENIFFGVDIVIKNIKTWKSKYGLSRSVLLSTRSTRHYCFPKHFFRIVSVCWAILQKFLKEKSDAYK